MKAERVEIGLYKIINVTKISREGFDPYHWHNKCIIDSDNWPEDYFAAVLSVGILAECLGGGGGPAAAAGGGGAEARATNSIHKPAQRKQEMIPLHINRCLKRLQGDIILELFL